nr:MAG TPA: hypothetical protein [Caudoviricetes sp.]
MNKMVSPFLRATMQSWELMRVTFFSQSIRLPIHL